MYSYHALIAKGGIIISNYQERTDLSSLDIYLKEVSKKDLLTKQEEKELFERLKEGDNEAKEKIINSNLRLVISNAKNYINRGLDLSDLIQEGNIGLIRAVEKFDYQKGYSFSTYATYWIKQAISRSLEEKSKLIRIPSHMIGKIEKINSATRKFVNDFGIEPTDIELESVLEGKLTAKDIKDARNAISTTISFEQETSDDGKSTLADLIADENQVLPDELTNLIIQKETIKNAVKQLSEKEQFIINKMFGLEDNVPMTLEEVGNIVGLTKEGVRQISKKALLKLRSLLEENN